MDKEIVIALIIGLIGGIAAYVFSSALISNVEEETEERDATTD